MPFKVISKKSGKTYYLHSKLVKLAGGRKQTIYYFAGTIGDNTLDKIPDGFMVSENNRTGLPMLKRK
jgi:hypothetical protein